MLVFQEIIAFNNNYVIEGQVFVCFLNKKTER